MRGLCVGLAPILSHSRAGTPVVDEHLPHVYRFALRLTRSRQEAEDLTQEVFLQAWRRRDQRRDPHATRVWLFTIAANLWRDRLRREARRRPLVELSERECTSAVDPPDRALIVREDVCRVLQMMDSLPPRQREVLYLHACEGLVLAEIAAALGISPEAVKASLCQARKRLRRRFREYDCGAYRSARDFNARPSL
ncbi:MAG: RNA polymerase sigma factor [Planctomycetes bacterium]|nr:RNA polymerase sigma factor [Planctomycetota bacterium]